MKGKKPNYHHSKNVVIIQRVLPHYRIPFFEELSRYLEERKICLKVVYGSEQLGAVPKTATVNAKWARKVNFKYHQVFGKTIYYLNPNNIDSNCDLLVLEHAIGFLNIYFLFFKRKYKKIGLWGHGENMQDRGRNIVKEFFLKRADWWFGYTAITKKLLERKNYDLNKVSIVNNTIDTSIFHVNKNEYEKRKKKILEELGIKGENVCVYCGGIYSHKKIDFLLAAANELTRKLKDFYLVVIGEGPEQHKIEAASAKNHRIKYVGPKFQEERIPYLMLAKAMLMPGLVGLVIVDSFSAKTPIITTNIPIHSPEIEYLDHGVNGLMVEYDKDKYVEVVINYLSNKSLQKKLKFGCEISEKKFSMRNMAKNFGEGVVKCMEAKS